jgi:hypothetical protein
VLLYFGSRARNSLSILTCIFSLSIDFLSLFVCSVAACSCTKLTLDPHMHLTLSLKRGGLLLPGNAELGVIRYHGKHYSFASISAMRDFCATPEKFVARVTLTAKKNPALVHLLCLQDQVPCTDIAEILALDSGDGALGGGERSSELAVTTTSAEMSCQTPTHITAFIPDPHYEWNEWELRRKALRLANLTSKRTHSTQTHQSHFRRDNVTQTTLPTALADGSIPGVGTMTGVEKGTNVARTTRYFTGLRGAPSSKFGVASVTHADLCVDGTNPPLNKGKK